MSETSQLGPGTVLAERYELTDIIGRGGFGTVWKARQMNMDRDVAIKVLPPQFQSVSDVVERFKREARLASRLRHPNTITLHDYGQHQDFLYIVMELLQGEDLADVLKAEGRLSPERIMHIARQVLKSLAEAHDQKIVHRDLKPENIFLSVVGDDRDHVKVVDFGIAKLLQPTAEDAVQGGRRLTMSGSTVGTPTYMSPEQAAGEDVDGQTDLYALGIIMFEAVNGRPPFHDRDPVKIMRAQLFEPVPELRDPALRGSLLDRVIKKALQKEKGQRFKTAQDMLLALAGEAVAQPIIQGIPTDLAVDDSLAEATSELIEPPPRKPTTGEPPAFASTLSFVQGIARERTDEDSIPFGAVDAHADTMAPPRATVRTAGANRENTPPSGASGGAATSSILTVIAPPDDAAVPDDGSVILLTRKKTAEPAPAPAPPKPVAAPAAAVSAAAAATEPAAPLDDAWEWNPAGELDHRAPAASAGHGLAPIILLIAFLLLGVAAFFLF